MDIRNKRILVTGGSGFLGGHVQARLRDRLQRSLPHDIRVRPHCEPDVLRLLQRSGPRW